MYKIFDSHVHIYPESIAEKACENLGLFYNVKVLGKGTYDDYIMQAEALGQKGFLIFSVATNPKNVEHINDMNADLVRQSIEKGYQTVGFMAMHQDYPDYKSEIERCIKMGLRGVKIHSDFQQIDIDSPQLIKLYEIIEGRIPIVLHMGDDRPEYRFSEPKKLAHVLDMFPNLEVLATHMGGYLAWDEAKHFIFGRPNVWYDASSFFWAVTPEKAVEIIRAAGTDRVMYGTDYPLMPIKDYYDLFMKCDLTEQEREDILYNNAKRFLSL